MRIINFSIDTWRGDPRHSAKVCKSNDFTWAELIPPSNGQKIRPIRITLPKGSTSIPARGDLFRARSGALQIDEERETDNRCLLLLEIPQAGHRCDTRYDDNITTAKVVDSSAGYGAWGSGEVVVAILDDGQRIAWDVGNDMIRCLTWSKDHSFLKDETLPEAAFDTSAAEKL